MRYEKRGQALIAVLEKDDNLRSQQEVLALLGKAFARDCNGFVIEKDLIMGAMQLFSKELQASITARYGNRNPRVAIVGRLPRLVDGLVKGFISRAGLEQSVLFCPDMEAALTALSA